MRRIVIGDLHLQESRPDITEGFIRFLREECLRCDEFYILGDLFEAWIGDDERADLSERVAWELQRLRRPGKFFINTVDNAYLDFRSETRDGWGYCVFGKVTEGTDTVEKIEKVKTGTMGYYMRDVPKETVEIISAREAD